MLAHDANILGVHNVFLKQFGIFELSEMQEYGSSSFILLGGTLKHLLLHLTVMSCGKSFVS